MFTGQTETQAGEGGITGLVRLCENKAEIYNAVNGYSCKPNNLPIKAFEGYANQVKAFATKICM